MKATCWFCFKKRKERKPKSAGAWCFAQNIRNRVLGCVQTKLDDATKIGRSVLIDVGQTSGGPLGHSITNASWETDVA